MCWHRWSKWTQYQEKFMVCVKDKEWVEDCRSFQRRKCEKCDKVEVERIYG
jgi:hypothetical protein